MKLQKIIIFPVFHFSVMLALLMGLASCQPSCQPFRQKATRFWIVFVDTSGSTLHDRGNYNNDLDTLVNQVKPGDRFLVSTIHGKTMINFVPVIDRTVPSYDPIFDNELAYANTFAITKKLLKASIKSPMTTSGQSDKTEILDCFKVAEERFKSWPSKKILVIFSDMLECSSNMDLEKQVPDSAFIEKKLRQLEKEGRIAQLHGVEVIVAGAGGNGTRDSNHYRAVEKFWRAYIAKTGGQLVSYSHYLDLSGLEKL